MSKKIKILFICVAVAAVITIAVVVGLFAPRHGTPYYSYWSPYDELGDKSDTTVVNLEKKAGIDFKILQLADIQIESYNKKAKETFATITELINESAPDLIVMTGDNVAGNFAYSINKRLVKFIDGFGIPWAPLFGNHDAEFNTVDQHYLAEQFTEAEHCLFKHGPSNIKGVGNYVINIKENNNIVYSMHMLDSNMYDSNINGGAYDYIGYSQIEYFEWYANKLNEKYSDKIPVMSFFHIPPLELLEEYNRLLTLENAKPDKVPVPYDLGTGEFREAPCPSTVNSGYVDMGNRIGMTHMFFGHDHINDASIKIKDIVMTYGLKTGRASYIADDMNGGTLISVSGDRNVSFAKLSVLK